jgi:hypothetical protein
VAVARENVFATKFDAMDLPGHCQALDVHVLDVDDARKRS